MATTKRIPRIRKPTTAYKVLDEVCRVIQEEPRRYDQGIWGTRSLERMQLRGHPPPACGTVCCVAGWTQALVTGNLRFDIRTMARAQNILGISGEDAGLLFDSSAVRIDADSGTRAYARAGVKHIRSFQKEHAAELKAKIVKPGSS